MTREHKLALIVGFSLVLLVGVLIADHLSLARRAQIAPVGERELTVARGPTGLVDPLRAAEQQWNAPPPELIPEQPAVLDPAVLAGEVPQLERFAPEPPPVLEQKWAVPEPLHIAQGRYGAPAEQADAGLISAARAQGWDIRPENGGLVMVQGSQMPQAGRERPVSAPGATTRPAGAPAPAAANIKTYTVQRGDTYFKIAERHYGEGRLWRELMKYNAATDDTVRLGASLKIPPREVLTGRPAPVTSSATASAVTQPKSEPAAPRQGEQKKSEPSPARPARTEIAALTYTVQRGDTLGEIAQRKLGTSRRWREIADLNKLDDVDMIPAGTVLRLPAMRG